MLNSGYKEFSKKNMYYKYYNADNIPFRLKIDPALQCYDLSNENIIIKFKDKNDIEWNYHIISTIDKKINNVFDIINYIAKNISNTNLVFNVTLANNKKF